MKPKIQITWSIVVALCMGRFYYGLVNTHPHVKFFETREMLPAASNILHTTLNLPAKDEYILKIKHMIKKEQAKTVLLNGNLLEMGVRKKGYDILTEYYRVAADVTRVGQNSLKINFHSGLPPEVEVWIRNYITRELGGALYSLSADSRLIRNRPKPILYSVIFAGVLFLIWQGLSYLWQKFFAISKNKTLLFNIISFSPSFLIMGLAWTLPNFKPGGLASIHLLISSSYLYSLVIFSVILAQIIILSSVSIKSSLRQSRLSTEMQDLLPDKSAAITPKKELPLWMVKTIDWLKRREFSDKCILLFIALLMMCAFLLILHLEPIAEQLANIAYFSLVIGVVIKFVKFIREEKTNTP